MARSRRSSQSRIPQNQRKGALEQLRNFRATAEELELSPEPRSNRPEVSNQELLEELRIERNFKKFKAKNDKAIAKLSVNSIKSEDGPKTKIEFSGYNPGELVMITKRAVKRYNLSRLHLYEGATGVIVEEDNFQDTMGIEKGRWLLVMGPNGLEKWDAKWCTHGDDISIDEEDED